MKEKVKGLCLYSTTRVPFEDYIELKYSFKCEYSFIQKLEKKANLIFPYNLSARNGYVMEHIAKRYLKQNK